MIFIPKAEFAPLLTAGKFSAHTEYQGEWYGTLAQDIFQPLEQGRKVLVAFDEHGVDCVAQGLLTSVNIYLYPPSLVQLEKWLLKRWPKKGPQFDQRLNQAIGELQRFRWNKAFKDKFNYWLESTENISELTSAMLELMGFYNYPNAA